MGAVNQRDTKLVQWLNEAHAKEAELEADLTAHIALTEKQSYKKRLRGHLKETRDHKRRVSSRIKKLGGTPLTGPDLPGVPDVVGEAAGKAVAGVKGQVGTARALVTTQPETHLRNAQEELREEHVEIALYTRLESLAEAVGDRDTAQLARSIRRDEERMAKFLNAELQRLVREVVRSEIPSDQRRSPRRARRSSSRKSSRASSSGRSRSGSSRSTRGRSGSRSSSSRSSRSSSSSRSRTRSSSRSGTRSSSRSGRSSSRSGSRSSSRSGRSSSRSGTGSSPRSRRR
jgi:ferritin-like metal-binding protein YciE